MRIEINRLQLLAALEFTAKKDIRYYLQGVSVEASSVETRLIATDGCVLAAQRLMVSNGVDRLTQLILPNDVIKSIKGVKGTDVHLTQDNGTWLLHADYCSRSFVPVDGRFPDYARVIPLEVSGVAGNFDAELLFRFKKAIKILGGEMFVRQNGVDAAYVGIEDNDNFIGVCMPMRILRSKPAGYVPTVPSWGKTNI